jgi:hypothetical protein
MTVAGWIIMLVSVGGVTSLFAWCLGRVLFGPKAPDPDQLHSALDIDTGDTGDTGDSGER